MTSKSSRSTSKNTIFIRLFRSVISIIILTAFVLGISFLVKSMANMDPIMLAKLSRPVLSKLNIDEDKAGEVAGIFVRRISQTGIHKGDDGTKPQDIKSDSETDPALQSTSKPKEAGEDILVKIALMADSEDDFKSLEKALVKAKDLNADKVFFLGDLTSFGDVAKLQEGKKVLDSGGIPYFIIPGDHDLAASDPAGDKNFKNVFDMTHQTATIGDTKFVLFDNSKNFTPMAQADMDWFAREVKTADYVMLSQPLYHPTLRIVMGIVDGKEVPEVRSQAEEMLNLIRGFDVQAIVGADQHIFSQNPDKVKPELQHYVVGAIQDVGLRNPEGSNFEMMTVYNDGAYKIEKIELK